MYRPQQIRGDNYGMQRNNYGFIKGIARGRISIENVAASIQRSLASSYATNYRQRPRCKYAICI